jgi:hypothetical protein
MELPAPPLREPADWVEHRQALWPPAFRHPDILFGVRRSLNANVVVYQVRRSARDPRAVDPDHPLSVYFLSYDVAHDRWFREELTYLERTMAYGVAHCVVRDAQHVDFTIKPLPNVQLSARLHSDGHSMAHVTLSGDELGKPGAASERCRVHSVDVKLGRGDFLSVYPKVHWVRLNAYAHGVQHLVKYRP